MNKVEKDRHDLQSLQLLKLAIEQVRTNLMHRDCDSFISAASKFEMAVDTEMDKFYGKM